MITDLGQAKVVTAHSPSASVYTGLQIPVFAKREAPFGRRKLNWMLSVVNSLLLSRINPPAAGDVRISDGGATWDLSRIAQAVQGGTGGGNMNYQGVYSGSTDYALNDVVYVGSTPAARYFYVCEIVNGPTSAVQAPDPTEASTVYWRLIAGPGIISELTFSAWGYGGNNDYITASGLQVRLPPLLRFSISSRTVHGVTISYSSYDATNQQRNATVGANSIAQIVTPAYVSGDKIYASLVGGVLQDLNVDGRVWAGPST